MTSRDVYFFGNACAFSGRKAVSVPTSVIGGLGAPWQPAILFNVGGQTGKDCLLTWADGVKVADRRDRTRNLSLRKRCTNHCTTGPHRKLVRTYSRKDGWPQFTKRHTCLTKVSHTRKFAVWPLFYLPGLSTQVLNWWSPWANRLIFPCLSFSSSVSLSVYDCVSYKLFVFSSLKFTYLCQMTEMPITMLPVQ